ncbi:retropepsin-like aspartic protease family protein [Mycobacterium tuberculosis]|uniref:retropepsin-like aspartic protease family protein n=1 Tax=Mycobacterium tuberculosis TaxID=1773 RepID=UPI002729D17F|nr:retroviral-like aspartic protease family protein [Mycobacterium tuberculosis]
MAASLYDYAKDQLRQTTSFTSGANFSSGAGRLVDQNGTGWTTLVARGTWRPQGVKGAHIVDFGGAPRGEGRDPPAGKAHRDPGLRVHGDAGAGGGRHDVCIQNLPVVFALDRGGLVGADGPTHHGAFDLSYLRCLPNMTVMAPADENECRQMLYTAFMLDTPTAVRYPRGSGPGIPVEAEMKALPVGKGEIRRQGKRIAILAFGSMVTPALAAAAEAIGLRYQSGQTVQVSTANGVTVGWRVKLSTVRLGSLDVYDVEALVTPAPMPYVLLGNSYLTRFQMTRTNDQLVLEQRY